MSSSLTEVPVWQRDETATECCICNTRFTLFFRRHHCRKCGRVVCGNCSANQRNYLPSTYVVCPPTQIFLESPHVPHRTCLECTEELDMIRQALEGSEDVLEDASATAGAQILLARDVEMAKSSGARETTRDLETESSFCPICNKRIASLAEPQKEKHINDCLQKAQFSGSPEVSRSPNRMIVYRLPKTFTKFKRLKEKHAPDPFDQAGSLNSFDSNGIGNLQEHTSHLPIHETYGSDDESNECCICLEEFRPQDKVGRLECLCIFHYKCITDWFKRRGPGECPVHAVHS